MCLSLEKYKGQLYGFPYTRKFAILSSMTVELAILFSNAIFIGIILPYPQTLLYVSGKLPLTPLLSQHFALSEKLVLTLA